MNKLTIFWFRQDLRIHDNIWLYNAVKDSKQVIPIFIFDKNILDNFPSYDKRTWFIFEAVEKLDKELHKVGSYLQTYYWDPAEIFSKLISQYEVDAVYTNRSYWTYWIARDSKIYNICEKKWIKFNKYSDFLLVEPESINPYKVFTPFYRKWQTINKNNISEQISKISSPDIYTNNIKEIKNIVNPWENKYWEVEFWKDRLNSFDFNNYELTRNFPSVDWTSRLSPYIRFGLLSIRQIYHHVKNLSSKWWEVYISELAWREFWHHISYHFPESKILEFQEKRRWINRENNEKLFEAWKKWETWYPIIDAAMRQLNEENWMHNRLRMVVASFLTKDLLIDWRWWEKYFKDLLIDYDENLNIWNWQWSASVGADPKPMRIFSPILQSTRFDPEWIFIKKYIPELSKYSLWEYHDPLKYNLSGYIKPIINHYEYSKKAKNMYFNKN